MDQHPLNEVHQYLLSLLFEIGEMYFFTTNNNNLKNVKLIIFLKTNFFSLDMRRVH